MDRLEWQRPGEVHTDDGHAVEIIDGEDGVVLRYSGTPDETVTIPRWAWADFMAETERGEYRDTLPSAREVLARAESERETRNRIDSEKI
jgi:hypothetical protein